MAQSQFKKLCFATGLIVPFLTYLSPNWFTISGLCPSWAVIWLLPFSLEFGPISGVLAGLLLGFFLDSISLSSGPTQIPLLIILGFWWGRLARSSTPIEGSFNLGLLACIGTFLLGLSLLLQTLFFQAEESIGFIVLWGVRTIFSEVFITGLLAPLLCAWLLLLFRKRLSF